MGSTGLLATITDLVLRPTPFCTGDCLSIWTLRAGVAIVIMMNGDGRGDRNVHEAATG